MFQMKNMIKAQEKKSGLNGYKLPDKEFKVVIIRMFTELGRRIEEHRISTKRKYEKEPVQDEEYSS